MLQNLLMSRFKILILLITLTGGCGGGSAAVKYYLVDPVQYNEVTAPAGTGPILEIIDVHVPQYMEGFHIATRREASQLHFSEMNQWGENLRKNLLRTLARNLSVLLGSNDIATPLTRSMSNPDYRVQVHIEQFERGTDGLIRLVAGWQVSGRDNLIITMKADLQGTEQVSAEDFDSIVSGMQSLYGQLSQKIADSIRSAATTAGKKAGT